MNPRPFFPPYNVRFRRGTPKSLLSMEWECQASESSFISWDFWKVSPGFVVCLYSFLPLCLANGDRDRHYPHPHYVIPHRINSSSTVIPGTPCFTEQCSFYIPIHRAAPRAFGLQSGLAIMRV